MKIVLLGNPLPVVGNPLRLAEELAMIDMISGGRLVTGWVRGAGSEQFASNANPAFNREYFNEAHELVIKAWTKPGPFRYEGKHFHYRFVDPWCLPMQKPHPPIWIPGLLSPETVVWCAKHRYPYVALATFLEPTVELWDIYRDAAAKEGYQVGPRISAICKKFMSPRPTRRRARSPSGTCSAAPASATACSASRNGCSRPDTIQRMRRGASRKQFTAPRPKGESARPGSATQSAVRGDHQTTTLRCSQVEHASASMAAEAG